MRIAVRWTPGMCGHVARMNGTANREPWTHIACLNIEPVGNIRSSGIENRVGKSAVTAFGKQRREVEHPPERADPAILQAMAIGRCRPERENKNKGSV